VVQVGSRGCREHGNKPLGPINGGNFVTGRGTVPFEERLLPGIHYCHDRNQLMVILWVSTPCVRCIFQHFGGLYCLHLQGENGGC
jgi:hypothetical protein